MDIQPKHNNHLRDAVPWPQANSISMKCWVVNRNRPVKGKDVLRIQHFAITTTVVATS